MKRPRVDLADVKARILCRLHWAMANNENLDGEIARLSSDVGRSPLLVSLAVDELRSEGLCWRSEGASDVYVEISRRGIEDVEGWSDDLYYQVAKKLNLPFVEGGKESGSEPTGLAPASDRIVTLDHNKTARQKAVESLQEVIAEAEKSNEFGQLFADPSERLVVLSEMKSGLTILKDEAVARLSTIKNFIADKLAMIANKLPEIMLGELAKKALGALGELIKGLL